MKMRRATRIVANTLSNCAAGIRTRLREEFKNFTKKAITTSSMKTIS